MPLLHMNFDLLVLLFLVAIVFIGFITGATIEFIKLIKLIIPFLIVFYFGATISRFVFKSSLFRDLISKISFLEGISYFNTLIMFLSTFIAFFGSYFIIGKIIDFIQNRIQSEIVNYKLGKVNNYFGGFIALARFYILASILILPFYMLSITTKSDFTTKLIMEHQPGFTRVGHLVNSSGPLLDASNSLNNFIQVVDLDTIKKGFKVVTDTYGTLKEYETSLENSCTPDTTIKGDFPTLEYIVLNPSACSSIPQESIDKIIPYKGLIIWSNELSQEGIDLSTIDNETLINRYMKGYNGIYTNTDDELMKTRLKKAYEGAQIYTEVSDWLNTKCKIQIDTENLLVLIQDENLQIIINQLVDEYSTHPSDGLVKRLEGITPELDKKLVSLDHFIDKYIHEYEPQMEELTVQLPFKAKLLASTLKDFDFVSSLKRSPLLSMYVIDTIDFVGEANFRLTPSETLEQSLVKILFEIYLFDDNKTFSVDDMNHFLTEIDQARNDVILTDAFVIHLTDALATSEYISDTGSIPYLTYAISQGKISKEAVLKLANYHLFKEINNDETTEIIQTLTEIGGNA